MLDHNIRAPAVIDPDQPGASTVDVVSPDMRTNVRTTIVVDETRINPPDGPLANAIQDLENRWIFGGQNLVIFLIVVALVAVLVGRLMAWL